MMMPDASTLAAQLRRPRRSAALAVNTRLKHFDLLLAQRR